MCCVMASIPAQSVLDTNILRTFHALQSVHASSTVLVYISSVKRWRNLSLKTPAAHRRMVEEGISVYAPGQLGGRTEKKTYSTKWNLLPGVGTSRSYGTRQLLGNTICY